MYCGQHSQYLHGLAYFNVYNSSPGLHIKKSDYRKVNQFAERRLLVNNEVRSKLWKYNFRAYTFNC